MANILDLLNGLDTSEYPNMDSAPRIMPKPTKTAVQYPNSPMDPRANQKSILDELINAGPSPSADLLSKTLYDYGRTPQENMASGAALAMDLPALPPQTSLVDRKRMDDTVPVTANRPANTQPKVTKPLAAADTSSMSGDEFTKKMLREQDQQQSQDIAEAEAQAAEQKAQELAEVKPEGDPELEAAQALAAERRRDLLLQQGVNQLVSGAVGAPEFYDVTKNELLRQYAEEPLTNLEARRKSAKDKKASAREDERFGMEKEKFQMDKEMGQLNLDKMRRDMEDSEEGKDPSSPLSQGFRQFMSENAKIAGVNLDPAKMQNLSYSQLSKLSGAMSNLFTAKMAADSRRDAAKEAALNREANRENKLTKENNDKIQSLRKEATAGEYGKIYGNYLNADRNKKIIEEFAKNPTGYSDYGTLMGSLKVLQGDQSVVREAEIKLGMNAGSLMDTITNTIQRPATGKSLTPRQRQAILQAMNIMHAKAQEQYLGNIEPLLEQADEMKIDRKFILPSTLRDINTQKQQKQETQTTSKSYSEKQEAAIKLVMDKNKVSRQEAISALTEAGKL